MKRRIGCIISNDSAARATSEIHFIRVILDRGRLLDCQRLYMYKQPLHCETQLVNNTPLVRVYMRVQNT